MRRFIFLLSICVFGFAGWTVWNDPTVGPIVQSWVPDSFDTASLTASIRETAGVSGGGSSGGGGATGQYGGIGAAGRIAGAVTGGN